MCGCRHMVYEGIGSEIAMSFPSTNCFFKNELNIRDHKIYRQRAREPALKTKQSLTFGHK